MCTSVRVTKFSGNQFKIDNFVVKAPFVNVLCEYRGHTYTFVLYANVQKVLGHSHVDIYQCQ